MSFEQHITFSTNGRANPFEFDIYKDNKNESFQIKIGNKFYSIKTKNAEDLINIIGILQKGIGEKALNSVKDLTHNISLLSSVKDVKINNIYHVAVNTLSNSSSLSSWSEHERQLKHNAATLFWENKVVKEPENSFEGFIGFLRSAAQYDDTIDNQNDRLANDFMLAIKTGNKERFLELFKSLPLGMIGIINHEEGLSGFPENIKRNPEKRVLTDSDLVQLQQYMKEIKFSGVICLSDTQGQTYTLSSDHSLKADTPFAMHSIGKMFTGILAIKMIEMGIIPSDPSNNVLDKPIQLDPKIMDLLGKYCPAVKEHLTKEGAPTFRQLMLHEGGLDDYLDKYVAAIQEAIDSNEPIPKIDSPEDFIKFCEDKIHKLKQGETHYSNLGLLLTGLSIQHLYNSKHSSEKKTYQELLEKAVLKPAGISSFSLSCPKNGCYNEHHAAAAHIQGGPAGGYWINPMDLLKFGEWTAKQCENMSFYELVKEYGSEFQPEKAQGADFNPEELSHGGQINSATSFLGTFLPNGITIAILSNRPFQAPALEGAIKDYILSKKD